MRMPLLPLLAVAAGLACDREVAQKAVEAVQLESRRPDQLPTMREDPDAFRYPPWLYAEKVQGNVTLRIHVDSAGTVVRESTTVAESSGYPELDSAAIRGSERVAFEPARIRGRPVAMSILLPVYFRHPDEAPLPGDTILERLQRPPQ